MQFFIPFFPFSFIDQFKLNEFIFFCSLVASILANLIAFVSFLTFLDAVINYFGMMIDLPELSFKVSKNISFIHSLNVVNSREIGKKIIQ